MTVNDGCLGTYRYLGKVVPASDTNFLGILFSGKELYMFY